MVQHPSGDVKKYLRGGCLVHHHERIEIHRWRAIAICHSPNVIGVLKKCHSQMYWGSWELLAANLRLHGGNSWIDPRKDASGILETQNVRNSGEDLHPGEGGGVDSRYNIYSIWWFQPRKCESNWILSTPKVWGEKKKYVKPPPVIWFLLSCFFGGVQKSPPQQKKLTFHHPPPFQT